VTAADRVGTTEIVVRLTETGVSNPRQSASQTITITLTPVNDAPFVSIPTSIDVQEDQGLVSIANFATNLGPGPITAVDEVGQTLTIQVNAQDTNLFSVLPAIDSAGTLTFRMKPDFNSDIASVFVTVVASDDGSNVSPNVNTSTVKTFAINVQAVNDPPSFSLSQTSLSSPEDIAGNFASFANNIVVGPATATDELANQVPSFIVTAAQPELFSVQPSINANGQLTFVPAPNRNGNTLVFVQLSDGGPSIPPNQDRSATTSFTLSITPANDPPEFSIPAAINVEEDGGLVTITGFATGIRRGPTGADDENSQTVGFEVVADDATLFVVPPTIGVDGTLTYQTASNRNSANGNFGVSVRLRDSGLASPAPNNNLSVEHRFTITVNPVNDSPIADSFTTQGTEDSPLEIFANVVLDGDVAGPTSDELAPAQQVRMVQIETSSAQGGTVTPVFDVADPTRIVSFTYQPASNFAGIDTILYVVRDNGSPQRSGTGTISIDVQGLNDAPSFNAGVNQSSDEDSGLISIPNWATNIAAGPPAASDELLTQTVGFTVSASNSSLFSVQPSVDADGTLIYQPAKDANGSSVVVVRAVDSGSGTAPNINTSAPQTFTITINAINDAPVFTPGAAIQVDEDAGAFSQVWATQIAAAAGILDDPATAVDEQSQTISFTVSVDRPELFSVLPTISSNGTLAFTTASNRSGQAVLSIQAVDAPLGGLSAVENLTITILPVNDAPIAVTNGYTTNEDTLFSLAAPGLLANDTDVDLPADLLKAVAGNFTSDLGAPVVVSEDGSMTYDPRSIGQFQLLTNGQSIADTFVYQIQDSAGLVSSPATVTITIQGIDDAPIAVDDSFAVGIGETSALTVLANDTDADSIVDAGTVEITANPGFGTVTVDLSGVVFYTPEGGFRGNDSFSYTVRDDAGNISNRATVTLVVNSAPDANNDNAFTYKNQPIEIDVLANDTDVDGSIDASTLQIDVLPTPAGTAEVLPNGKIRFTPAAGFSGNAQFSYSVADNLGTVSDLAIVRITVQQSIWQNPQEFNDVNGDGFVSPIDALLIINYLNEGGETQLPNAGITPPPYLDPSGDEAVTALDVLLVINFLNANSSGGAGEGEAASVTSGGNSDLVMAVSPTQFDAMTTVKLANRLIEDSLEIDELSGFEHELLTSPTGLLSQNDSWNLSLPTEDSVDMAAELAEVRELSQQSVQEAVDGFFDSLA
jgi:VCBS repeat-containing protein